MKARTLCIAAALSVMAIAAPASACPEGKDPERKVNFLRERLNLTDEQAEQVSGLIKAARERCSDTETKPERRACFKEERAKAREGIASILTEEQKAEFAKLREERKERFRDRAKQAQQ